MAILKRSTIDKARGTTRTSKKSNATPAIDIPVYLSSEEIPEADRHHPQLTIAAHALTDADELARLIVLANALYKERNAVMPYGRSAWTLQVIGPGAYPSARFPTISPEALDNRQTLLKTVRLVELPEKMKWDDKNAIRRYMKKRSDETDARLAKWHAEQRQLELQKSTFF